MSGEDSPMLAMQKQVEVSTAAANNMTAQQELTTLAAPAQPNEAPKLKEEQGCQCLQCGPAKWCCLQACAQC